jgi:hypothetical protein
MTFLSPGHRALMLLDLSKAAMSRPNLVALDTAFRIWSTDTIDDLTVTCNSNIEHSQ